MNRLLSNAVTSDRAIVGLSLAGITALGWLYVIVEADKMSRMDESMAMPHMMSWDASYLGFLFVMWSIMMVAMMVPSVTPMVMMFTTVNRKRRESDRTDLVPVGVFASGYLIAWMVFSAAAAVAQWTLHAAALVSPMMTSSSAILGGALLIAGGIYQWTPLKYACLIHCRTPMSFLMTSWRPGPDGRARHGVAPRLVLRGVLLGSDGAPVRRGRDERVVGCGHCGLRVHRESRATGRPSRAGGRRPARGRRNLGDPPGHDVVSG